MTNTQADETGSLRRRIFNVLEGGLGSTRSKLVNGSIVCLVLINVVAIVLESEAELFDKYESIFLAIEVFSVAVFTIEYVIRLWAWTDNPQLAGKRKLAKMFKFIFSPMGIIDLLAFLPFYASMIFAVDLRYLRLMRLIRLLKLSHYFHGLDLFVDVLKSEAKAIVSAILALLILIVVIASLMFAFENDAQPEAFGSIPASIWWSVVTLTTVGYGDITPITIGGRVLAIVIMLLGVGLLALPAGILAAKFSEEMKVRRDKLADKIGMAYADGEMDEHEHLELLNLRDSLRLPKGYLERMMRIQQEKTKNRLACPSCGHALSISVETHNKPHTEDD